MLDLWAKNWNSPQTGERKLERRLRDAYLSSMQKQCETLRADNLAAATNLAVAPLDVRGFGPVKQPAADALLSRLIGTAARDLSS